jgi:hypothetical protein
MKFRTMLDLVRVSRPPAAWCAAALALAAPVMLPTKAVANPTLTPGVWTNITPPAANLGSGNPGYFPEGFTIDPSNPNILYFCLCGFNADFSALPGSIWKTTDGGSNWTKLPQLDQPIHVRVDPNNSNHLYAVDGVRGNTAGFWISNNGGTTWTQPAGFTNLVSTLTSQGYPNFNDQYTVDVEPGNFNHILISPHSCDSVIGESTDGGTTWVAHHTPAAVCSGGYAAFFLYNKAHTIGNAQTWLLCTQTDGFYRTTNSGASWTKVTTTSMVHGGQQIYYASNGTLFAGAWAVSGPIRSTDNGITWQTAGTGSLNSTMGIIGDGTSLYTGRAWGTGPFITSPETDGVTWTNYNGGSQSFACGPMEMGYDSVNRIVYASMTENGRPGSTQDGVWALKVPAAGPPAAPTGLTATPGNTQVALTWNASGGATAYDVKRSTVSGSGYAVVSSPTATNYTNTGLTNGTTYYFVVSAKNAQGSSANSAQASATPTGTPPAESAYSGSACNAAAWAVPGTVQVENYDCGGEGVAYHDLDVPNNGGQGRTAERVDIETTTDTGGGQNVGWTGAGEYLKYICNVSSAGTYDINFRVASTATGACHLEDTNGTNLTGSVAIPNTGGWQTWQTVTKTGVSLTAGAHTFKFVFDSGAPNLNWISFASAGGSPPPVPTGLAAVPTDAQIALSWNASSGATAYDVKRSTVSGSGYATINSPTTTSYTNTGLTNGATYFYVVAAKNASGSSANSSQVSGAPAQYHFESGTQGWTASGAPITGVAQSTTQAFGPTHSLAVTINGAAANCTVRVANPPTPAGKVVTCRVWIPTGSQLSAIQPYVMDFNWAWTGNVIPLASLTQGAWNTVAVTVPAGAAVPLKELGVEFRVSATWNATCYIDSISW